MVELTDTQQKALDGAEQPPVAVDPQTGQKYHLIRQEIYEQVQGISKPFNKGSVDDLAIDVYERFCKKA